MPFSFKGWVVKCECFDYERMGGVWVEFFDVCSVNVSRWPVLAEVADGLVYIFSEVGAGCDCW